MPKTITLALMDGPYESETTTTMLRIADSALRKGHKVNVFAYEGAVSLTMKEQLPHADPVKGNHRRRAGPPHHGEVRGGALQDGGWTAGLDQLRALR